MSQHKWCIAAPDELKFLRFDHDAPTMTVILDDFDKALFCGSKHEAHATAKFISEYLPLPCDGPLRIMQYEEVQDPMPFSSACSPDASR